MVNKKKRYLLKKWKDFEFERFERETDRESERDRETERDTQRGRKRETER